MTKLTTERLETIATWREKYGNGANVMIPAEEAELMARRILAYDQAAKNPVASCWSKGGILQRDQFMRYDVSSFPDGEIKLFAAPVLPKQPELVENLKKVMNNWLAMEPKLAFQPEFTDVMMLLDAEPAPAQPVIPEQPEFYTKIDRFLPECLKPGDISGERRNSRITELMGWFDRYYSGKANPKWLKPHVAELCYYILTVPQLSAQPVSEPYKLPSGYALVPAEPTAGMLNVGISEAMKLNANVRIVYQTMLAAAPVVRETNND